MDSSQQALQINGKHFSNFEFVFDFWPKIIFSKRERGMNIDQSAMCYISMDSSQRDLQTNRKIFFKFQNNSSN